MKTANATWAPSILRSAVDTIGEKTGTRQYIIHWQVKRFYFVKNNIVFCICSSCVITFSRNSLVKNKSANIKLAKKPCSFFVIVKKCK